MLTVPEMCTEMQELCDRDDADMDWTCEGGGY
jgi:hypothetical protein